MTEPAQLLDRPSSTSIPSSRNTPSTPTRSAAQTVRKRAASLLSLADESTDHPLLQQLLGSELSDAARVVARNDVRLRQALARGDTSRIGGGGRAAAEAEATTRRRRDVEAEVASRRDVSETTRKSTRSSVVGGARRRRRPSASGCRIGGAAAS